MDTPGAVGERSPPPPLPQGAAAWLELQSGVPAGWRGSIGQPARSEHPPPAPSLPEEADPVTAALAAAADWLKAPSRAGPQVDALWREFCRRCTAGGVSPDALSFAAESSVLALANDVGFDPVQSAIVQAEWARRARSADGEVEEARVDIGETEWGRVQELLEQFILPDAAGLVELVKVEQANRVETSPPVSVNGPWKLLWHRPGLRGCSRGAAAAVASVGFATRPGRAGEAVYFPAQPVAARDLPEGVCSLVLTAVCLGRTRVLTCSGTAPEGQWGGGEDVDTCYIPGEVEEYAVRRPEQCVPRYVVTVRVQRAVKVRSAPGDDEAAQAAVHGGEIFLAATEALRLAARAEAKAVELEKAASGLSFASAEAESKLREASDFLQSTLSRRASEMERQLQREAEEARTELGGAQQRVKALARRVGRAVHQVRGDVPGVAGGEVGVPLERSVAAAELLRLSFSQGAWDLPNPDCSCVCSEPMPASVLSAPEPAAAPSPSYEVFSADHALMVSLKKKPGESVGVSSPRRQAPGGKTAAAEVRVRDADLLRAVLSAGLKWAGKDEGSLTLSGVRALQAAAAAAGLPSPAAPLGSAPPRGYEPEPGAGSDTLRR